MSRSYEDNEEDYVVEALRDIRKRKNTEYEIMVKWEGYDDSQCTWELVSNLQHLEDDLGVQRDAMIEEHKLKSGRRKRVSEPVKESASAKRRKSHGKAASPEKSIDSDVKPNKDTKSPAKNAQAADVPQKNAEQESTEKASALREKESNKATKVNKSKAPDISPVKQTSSKVSNSHSEKPPVGKHTDTKSGTKDDSKDVKIIENMSRPEGVKMISEIHSGAAEVVSLVRHGGGVKIKVKKLLPSVTIWLATCEEFREFYSEPPLPRDLSAERSLTDYLLRRVRFHDADKQ